MIFSKADPQDLIASDREVPITVTQALQYSDYVTHLDFSNVEVYKRSHDKAKPVKRLGRKATGPRFLREAKEDLPKGPKIAG